MDMTEDNYNSEYSDSLNLNKKVEKPQPFSESSQPAYYGPPPAAQPYIVPAQQYNPPSQPYAPYAPPQTGAVNYSPSQYGAYAPAPNTYAPAAPTNKYAISSFLLSLAGLFFAVLTAVPGIILGHIALKQINNNGYESGKGFAIAGLVIGYVIVGFSLLSFLAFMFVVLASLGVTAANY